MIRKVKKKGMKKEQKNIKQGDPLNYEEAIKDNEWEKAIQKEIDSQKKLETWEESTLPKGIKAIDTKWIFRTKQDGTKKARLVAKGFQQISSHNNYAPVAKLSTIRLMLSIAVQEDMSLKQLDVPTAFLNGILDEDVYIKCPKGLKIGERKVLKLKKALYGLKEAPKCWNGRFHQFITGKGYVQSKYDYCLYRKGKTWILLYVDDILLLGNGDNIVRELEKEFKVKNLGEVKNYLGLEITRIKNRLEIKQTEMIYKLLEKFNMQECKTSKTPMEVNYNINITSDADVINVPFKELIGSLLYISTNSRPDITYAVSYLSRYLDRPTQDAWKAGKRILRYLKGTLEKGLLYTKTEDSSKLQAYSDADWAADKTDRKSTSGCVIYHGDNPVSWFSRKQTCTALSTAEAEYVAGAHSCVSHGGLLIQPARLPPEADQSSQSSNGICKGSRLTKSPRRSGRHQYTRGVHVPSSLMPPCMLCIGDCLLSLYPIGMKVFLRNLVLQYPRSDSGVKQFDELVRAAPKWFKNKWRERLSQHVMYEHGIDRATKDAPSYMRYMERVLKCVDEIVKAKDPYDKIKESSLIFLKYLHEVLTFY
ncbi:hypothetical protein evm_014540 [Chilo suppressalis]|nr:hypothetical protein evm_014540 [Chilo suppressalis]